MNIINVTPRGYCKGVVRAISIAKETALSFPDENIYILGMLVHNDYITTALAELNITTLISSTNDKEALLEQIDSGIVILSAHGSSDKIKKQAINKGLKIIDATCPDVLKTHELIKSFVNSGYHIIYIGKSNHPESQAIIDSFEHVQLISNLFDVDTIVDHDKLFLTNQTTMSLYDVNAIVALCKQRFPHIKVSEEICNATRTRQEAIMNLKQQGIEVLFVVGDPNSNNTTRLVEIGKQINIPSVRLIQSALELTDTSFSSDQKIAITSGASTPTYLTNQVIDLLKGNLHSPIIIDLKKIL